MSFFKEIKKQPLAVRQMMFGLCVVTTISLVGMIWYRSFETKLYVLMDRQPKNEVNSTLFAKDTSSPSLFASLSGILGSIKTASAGLFHLFDKKNTASVNDNNMKGEPRKLPLSGDR